ncbi:MAG: hypothetical protein ACFFDY_11785 [Candidatus Thorarchaeota archaeon]
MALTDLTDVEILQGSLSLLYVIICIIVGLKITFKYFEYKRKELLTLGITLILYGSPYYASGFSFVNYVLFDFPFDARLYLFLNLVFLPFGLITWFYSYFHLVSPRLKKKFLIPFSPILILLDIFIIILLIFDPAIIGTMAGTFDGNYTIFTLSFLIFLLGLVITISIMYFLHCQRSEDFEIKWRGRFLLIGMITFSLGIILDITPTNPIMIVLARLLLIMFAIEWYIGWLMPKSIAKRLIKGDIYVKGESKEKKAEFDEFMQLLKTKPESISEEEVIFHREKKICLVCKGKVGGFNTFICTHCDALYCQKCASLLSDLENQCWVCDTPFDESKPTNSFSKEKEEKDYKKNQHKNFREI